jgi:mRNA-degrading endonuclease toxin of MazEF toxin-antitoxin module
VPFQAGQFGFSKDCVAQCENIFLLDKNDLDPNPIGVLSDIAMRDVVKAIGHVVDADCEPN